MMKRLFLDEKFFLDTIENWQRIWMNVTGTDERDRKSYSNRAFGIDANMKYSLARLLAKQALAKIRGEP